MITYFWVVSATSEELVYSYLFISLFNLTDIVYVVLTYYIEKHKKMVFIKGCLINNVSSLLGL